MKPTILLLALLCAACTKQVDHETEKSASTKLIDDETRYAAAADSASWKKYWHQTDESIFTITSAEGIQQYDGWNAIQTGLTTDAKPFDLKIKRDNYQYTIGTED